MDALPQAAPRRADLDALRALAVTAVVAWHAASALVPGGYLGVDVFFVVSGFLVTGLLVRDGTSTPMFWLARARRILPGLLVVLAATLGAAVFTLTPDQARGLGVDALAAITFSANLRTWATAGYFAPEAVTQPLLHLWSLAVEEQFYLLWPAILAGAAHRRPLVIFVLAVVSVAVRVSVAPDAAFYLLPARAWELLLGAWVAVGVRRRPSGPLADAAWLVAVVAMVAAALTDQGSAGVVVVCLAAAAAVWGGAGSPLAARLSAAPLVAVGRLSYGIYLWHWPALVLPSLALARPLDAAERTAAVVGSVALAWVTDVGVERPVRRWVAAVAPRRAAVGLAAATVSVAAMAGVVAAIGRPMSAAHRAFAEVVARDHTWLADDPCLLSATDDVDDFHCDGDGSVELLVWGDSFAAHLMPGVRDQVGDDVAVRTTRACAPTIPAPPLVRGQLLGDCEKLNASTRAWVTAHRPPRVLLAADWSRYRDGWLPALEDLVDALVAEGVDVSVVGPVVVWDDALPPRLERALVEDGVLPDTLAGHVLPEVTRSDAALRGSRVASRLRRPLAVLCVDPSCDVVRTLTPDGLPVAIDEGHLSPAGSLWLGRTLRLGR